MSADDVIPAAILQVLSKILANQQTIITNQETIMSDMAAEQQTINDMAGAVGVVAEHVSTASSELQTWIAAHSGTIDTSGLSTAVSSLQAADTTLAGVVPQADPTPLPAPVPDPGPPADPVAADSAPADGTAAADTGAATDTSGSLPS